VAQPSLSAIFTAQTFHSPVGADIYVCSAARGPVVLLIHGYAVTSDSWAPLAAELVKNYTVVVPDMRGIGRSSHPVVGYDKKTQGADIRAVVTTIGVDLGDVWSHYCTVNVAVARKLAVLLHRIWVTQEPYIPFHAVAA
jgi:pimeloyl-ACP methyl ester carboxylesterase